MGSYPMRRSGRWWSNLLLGGVWTVKWLTVRRGWSWSRCAAVYLASVLVVAGLLTSCSSTAGWGILNESEARLGDDVVFAIYVSPQTYNFGGHGYVLLVDEQGQISAIRTAGMDYAALTWTSQGLFFSDTDRDYLLTGDGLTAWSSPKTNLQVDTWEKPGGIGWVSLYNEGFGDPEAGEPGYVQQVVDALPGQSTRYDVAGFTWATSWCGSELYGISEIVEPFTPSAIAQGIHERSSPPYWPDMLTQLWPDLADPTEVLKSVSQDGRGGYGRTSACRDNTVLAVSGADNESSVVVSWPTDGLGTRTEHVITDVHGQTLNAEVAVTAKVADWAARADELVWHGGDGVIRATAVNSGRTHDLWDSGANTMRSAYNKVTFVGATAYVFDTLDDSSQPLMRLRSHDLVSGETREILQVRVAQEAVDRTLVLRDIAIRPAAT